MADHGLGTRASVPSPAPPGADVDLGPTLDIVVWVLISLSGLIMGLRLWCKWLRHRGLWWDDYVLISAWVCHLSFCFRDPPNNFDSFSCLAAE